MQVDLERLKTSIQEELSKLEQRRSRLEEGVLVIKTLQGLASEFENPGEEDSRPTHKPEATLEPAEKPEDLLATREKAGEEKPQDRVGQSLVV